MPAIYNQTLRTTRMTAVRDAIDGGTGAGVMQIGTTGMAVVLAEIVLGDPCGTVSGNVLTLTGMPRSDTAANATGTPAAARIRDSAGVDVVTGLTVGTTGTDVILDAASITLGQQVQINSATLTHAS